MRASNAHTAPRAFLRTLVASLACALLALSAFAMPALADEKNDQLDYEPPQNDTEGVSDFATDIKILKVDAQDNEAIAYAYLRVRNKETGKVVAEWRSTTKPKELKTVLDVDTTYILEETDAPRGYAKADPVEFTIAKYDENEMKESVLTILTGTDHARAQDKSTLVLTDARTPEYRQEIRNKPESDARMPQTGDYFQAAPLILLVAVGAGLLIFGLRTRRKSGK